MLDGRPLIDAHQHPVRLSTVKPAWMDWAERFGQPGWREAYTPDGEIIPQAFGGLMQAEGVDHTLVICEYSPKTTGTQPAEDLLPLTAHDPGRFSLVANINPHLHYPVDAELARQLALGAVALKVHPVHGGFSPADPALYPAYQACVTEGLPVVVHCGTSSFPGSSNELADPALLLPVLRDFPGLTVVLARGRGWWVRRGSLAGAAARERVDRAVRPAAAAPPPLLCALRSRRWHRQFIFGTDWPGVPGIARDARALAALGLGDDVLAGVLAGNALAVYPRNTQTCHKYLT